MIPLSELAINTDGVTLTTLKDKISGLSAAIIAINSAGGGYNASVAAIADYKRALTTGEYITASVAAGRTGR